MFVVAICTLTHFFGSFSTEGDSLGYLDTENEKKRLNEIALYRIVLNGKKKSFSVFDFFN